MPISGESTHFEAIGLVAGYGALTVLRDVGLGVGPAEAVAVVGSNGMGKSTLLRTLGGVVPPKRGTIVLGDRRLDSLSTDAFARAGVSLVPEGRALFASLTVADNLRLGGWAAGPGAASRPIDHIFERFPVLGERRRALAGSLSGGQQQLLAVARALMAQPKVLLLDEPSLGLAPRVLKELFEDLARLVDEGLSVVLAEQNVRAALSIAQTVVVLRQGQVVLTSPATDLAGEDHLRELYL